MDIVSKKINQIKRKRAFEAREERRTKLLEIYFNKIFNKTFLNQVIKLLDFLNEGINKKNNHIILKQSRGSFMVIYKSNGYYFSTWLFLISKKEAFVRSAGLDNDRSLFKDSFVLPKDKDKAFKTFIDNIELIDQKRPI